MTLARGRLSTFLCRWLPGWRLLSALAARAGHRRDEQEQEARLTRLGARPRDGPH